MPVKLRLQRHGKKGKPFYWLVAADSRAKRDGRYLEKLGTYNPNTNPATVNIDIDRAVNWMEKGAQPTDTARNLLSYKGVMLKYHLNGGVRKGALTQEAADQKLAEWLKEKEAKIQAKKEGLTKSEAEAAAKRLAAEKEASEKRLAAAAAEEAEAVAEQEPAAEEAPSETEAAPEEVKEEATATTEEVKEETPAEEASAEEEAPAAEAAAEDTPAEEGKTDAEEKEAE
ncbi:MAG: 30S ribosomal protein S16 [Flavobacteriaceae bacterium]|nr:30S ribosomal protein S16 [Flavobacteriaceae bacterium]